MLNNFELLSLMHVTASGIATVGLCLALVAAVGVFIALAADRPDKLVGPTGLLILAVLGATVGGAAQEWWQLITAVVAGGTAIVAGLIVARLLRTRQQPDAPQTSIDRIPLASWQ
ncbi:MULTISPECIES: hypothetical protein [Microbacterium]|uniref:Uncharacterized protein n=1 Tax=Microbacterium marmarense TaxID=3122051 RepID=A0ABU8LWJ3_9MICO